MQYHRDGFRAGNPAIKPAANLGHEARYQGDQIPKEVDVLIVGSGPAGLTLAAQLAQCPDITSVLIEKKSGPMEKGQADGVSCRSMEMFQAFGFAHQVMHEAYWVNETTFWRPDPKDETRIIRAGRVQDVEDGLSEMPHVILNQARVHDMYLNTMDQAPTRMQPYYNCAVKELTATADHVDVTITRTDDDQAPEDIPIRARYVVGCDGGRSTVRSAMDLSLEGDSANKAWGVMDVLAVTDFPDIRQKTLIQSSEHGTVLIIPREGGYLVRLYVEMESLNEGERIRQKNITADDLILAAQKIFAPYDLSVKELVWWSVYEIGQRLTTRFDNIDRSDAPDGHPRVFIAGDACHTHSPKAGQGMNVSMGDTFNLGWKLIHVLRGQSAPDLLRSYSDERHDVAKTLIEFDQEWARIISERSRDEHAVPNFQKYFIEHGRYTAGVSVRYKPSDITGTDDHQHLANGFDIGMRFHSAPVIRLADAKPMSLGHVISIDAAWRIFAFADASGNDLADSKFAALCAYLSDDPMSPLNRYHHDDKTGHDLIDVRAVLQDGFRDVNISDLPALLRPKAGTLGLVDYEKVFCPDINANQDIFDLRDVSRKDGALVLVRPDQYVAHVLPLDAYAALTSFFDNIFIPK